MIDVTDQLGRGIELSGPAQRIVSLVPSQTELLFDLGVGEAVVGRTRFCIHPEKAVADKAVVGGTKRFRFERIAELQPDLILGNKEENYQEGIERLQKDYPVWMSDIYTLQEALEMIAAVGQLTGSEAVAGKLITQIKRNFGELSFPNIRKAAYFIWKNPWMCVGGHTFIGDMMMHCGLENVFADRHRYPEVTPEQIRSAAPEILLLSSEPYPFSEAEQRALEKEFPNSRAILTNGTAFSWYGSRLREAPEYFRKLRKQMP